MTNSEEFEKRIGALCDDFRGHSFKECKEFNLGNRERKNMLRWEIMKGVLTPVIKFCDKVMNKVFKGYLYDIYDLWALTYLINTATVAPHPPTRKKCATWVVEPWEKLLEELCAKAWPACGYKTKNELASDKETSISAYTDE